jgi:prepilin-type N-terminal cleavage/methylation domain-containing protein
MLRRAKERGFSASELLVVSAVLALLLLVGVESARLRSEQSASAERSAARGQMQKDAKEAYLREVVSEGAYGFPAEVAFVTPFSVEATETPRVTEPVRLLDVVASVHARPQPPPRLPEWIEWRYDAR